MRMKNGRRGMTLVELLVVITIITIIGMMVMPALMKGVGQGMRSRAEADVSSLNMAVQAYFDKYGEWPAASEQAYSVDANLTAMFRGTNVTVDGKVRNAQRVRFLEIPDSEVVNGVWVDPWNSPYYFAVDMNGDGIVNASVVERGRFGKVINHGTIIVTGRQAVAFSMGPNTNLSPNVTDPGYDDVRSW